MLPVDGERLREFTRVLQKYKAGKASIERRTIAAENWWKLRNQAEERKSIEGLQGFQAVSGWLHNIIVSKHADAMEAYPEPAILPREAGDRQEAGMLSRIIPVILEQNEFEKTYSDAMWQKLKTGTGVYKVWWDAEKLSGLGDIAIERDMGVDCDIGQDILAYVETWFDVDRKFGTHTADDDSTWLNLYAKFNPFADTLRLECEIDTDRPEGNRYFDYEPTKDEAQLVKDMIAEKIQEDYHQTPQELCEEYYGEDPTIGGIL